MLRKLLNSAKRSAQGGGRGRGTAGGTRGGGGANRDIERGARQVVRGLRKRR
ncbi:hypothetical protein K8W59_15765 [Nocardioides rotundus]|uniref:hypothetical protein n=1 Tax=Nocardioides rotundus TaxID=1774216 RepID=UPI001CBEDA16|nr:hypothetical protein [Nocardioides rotundus]UAL29216.1 hypothetical protein K8W59_15765 [Nocardioides rotundus]